MLIDLLRSFLHYYNYTAQCNVQPTQLATYRRETGEGHRAYRVSAAGDWGKVAREGAGVSRGILTGAEVSSHGGLTDQEAEGGGGVYPCFT